MLQTSWGFATLPITINGDNMIKFNIPPITGKELDYIRQAIQNEKICGDGPITKQASEWLEHNLNVPKVLMTTSCTHALEMTAILSDIQPDDEVIMASYGFSSTANAFVMRGAKIVFIDIRPDTMNMDEKLVESAITNKTKAIVPMHYAGVSCEMNLIMDLAKKYNIRVIEDAAQGIMSTYYNKPLGSIGDFGTFSFHETKNYSMGEGGALSLTKQKDFEKAEILREKGTDRSKFLRGQLDKYTWQDMGSSYLPSELNVAYLMAQLEIADTINKSRLTIWERYYNNLEELQNQEKLQLPYIPNHCTHNAHMFYIKTKDIKERTNLIDYLKANNISAVFHYVPLHSANAGLKYGIFSGEDKYTTVESERLLRLPLYYGLSSDDVDKVSHCIKEFYTEKLI